GSGFKMSASARTRASTMMRETTVQPTSRPPWEGTTEAELTPGPAPRTSHRSPRTRRAAAIGATTLAVVLAGWIGVALADTPDPTTTSPPSSATAPAPGKAPGAAGLPGGPGGHGPKGFGGPGGPGEKGGFGGPGGAIHGQFTVPDGSGYRTIDQQAGTVGAVS